MSLKAKLTKEEADWAEDNVIFRRCFCKGSVNSRDTPTRKLENYIDSMNQYMAKNGQPQLAPWVYIKILEEAKSVVYLPQIFNPGE